MPVIMPTHSASYPGKPAESSTDVLYCIIWPSRMLCAAIVLHLSTLSSVYTGLKHTATLFSLSDHYIISRGWRVIVDQVQTNYHGSPMVL